MYKNNEDYESDKSILITLISAGLQFNREILLEVLHQSKWVNAYPTIKDVKEAESEGGIK